MKIRNGYVSNSSSSSFLISKENIDKIPGRFSYVKLDNEIIEAIKNNFVDWEGKKLDLSGSDEWYLTQFISDSFEEYSEISKIGVYFMSGGHGGPYGDDNEYYILKKDTWGDDEIVVPIEIITEKNCPDICNGTNLKKTILNILKKKSISNDDKITMIKNLLNEW